jgi:ferredoxin
MSERHTYMPRGTCSQVILIEEREDSCSQQQHDVIADIAFSAMDHLRAWGNDLDIDQIDVAPDGSAEEEELPVEADGGSSRRGFFKGLLDKTNETIANTAAVTLETYEQANQPRQTLSQTLMNEDGSMRTFPNDRNDRMMDDLYEIGEPVCDRLRSQRFGEVHVDTGKCQLCGLCARFCTSGALQGEASVRASAWGRRVDERKGYLTFRSNDCMQCHLCEAACFHEALSVSDEVDPHQLFEFEPVQLA